MSRCAWCAGANSKQPARQKRAPAGLTPSPCLLLPPTPCFLFRPFCRLKDTQALPATEEVVYAVTHEDKEGPPSPKKGLPRTESESSLEELQPHPHQPRGALDLATTVERIQSVGWPLRRGLPVVNRGDIRGAPGAQPVLHLPAPRHTITHNRVSPSLPFFLNLFCAPPPLPLAQNFVIADPTLPDCPIVFASDPFLHLTGYSREEVLGRNW